MRRFICFFILITLVCLQACIFKFHRYKELPDYMENIDSSGYVMTAFYEYDRTISAGKYRISEKNDTSMRYELMTAVDWHLGIYDTISFYFDFKQPDRSSYIFIDNEYNKTQKKYEATHSTIPLAYKGKLTNSKGCGGCNIFKFESYYRNECYTWFVSDSIGFVKTYGPYHYNTPNYEIRFMIGSPKFHYAEKIMKAIKADNKFHTRCSPGGLW